MFTSSRFPAPSGTNRTPDPQLGRPTHYQSRPVKQSHARSWFMETRKLSLSCFFIINTCILLNPLLTQKTMLAYYMSFLFFVVFIPVSFNFSRRARRKENDEFCLKLLFLKTSLFNQNISREKLPNYDALISFFSTCLPFLLFIALIFSQNLCLQNQHADTMPMTSPASVFFVPIL